MEESIKVFFLPLVEVQYSESVALRTQDVRNRTVSQKNVTHVPRKLLKSSPRQKPIMLVVSIKRCIIGNVFMENFL
jgi:hypothetical protein